MDSVPKQELGIDIITRMARLSVGVVDDEINIVSASAARHAAWLSEKRLRSFEGCFVCDAPFRPDGPLVPENWIAIYRDGPWLTIEDALPKAIICKGCDRADFPENERIMSALNGP